MATDLAAQTAVSTQPMPAAAPRKLHRPFSVSMGVGLGWLALTDNLGRDGQSALSLSGRATVQLSAHLMAYLGVEASGTSRQDSAFWHSAWLLGFQTHVANRWSFRLGMGPTWVRESSPEGSQSVGPGLAFSVGSGLELTRGSNVALSLEVTATVGVFANERWDMGGMNVVLTFF